MPTTAKSTADREKAAANDIDAGLRALQRALGHLRADDDELPFAAQLAEHMDGLNHVAGRLREYATHNW